MQSSSLDRTRVGSTSNWSPHVDSGVFPTFRIDSVMHLFDDEQWRQRASNSAMSDAMTRRAISSRTSDKRQKSRSCRNNTTIRYSGIPTGVYRCRYVPVPVCKVRSRTVHTSVGSLNTLVNIFSGTRGVHRLKRFYWDMYTKLEKLLRK